MEILLARPRTLTPEESVRRAEEVARITNENLWWRKLFHLRAVIARRQALQNEKR
ncbi:MAG: hypothetical protein MSG64_19895 [Pyrinomonadaceae bacterium MAG19_C2-C3]|nr:hypothetical protein [Pyrinomonadaceae bacterium MAG19_C2-C3]